VSVFRPEVRLESPDGRAWEIYAYKIQIRDRNAWHTGPDGAAPIQARPKPLPLRAIRRLGELAAAGVRSLSSDEWTVEAIVHLPGRESYAWTTTSEYKGQVLAQVEGQLARGDVPQRLTNATYLGARR
jgi:hypothetical protein